jgi:hypothetical protein
MMTPVTLTLNDITYTVTPGTAKDMHDRLHDAVQITASSPNSDSWSRIYSIDDMAWNFTDTPNRIFPSEIYELFTGLSQGVSPVGCTIDFPSDVTAGDDFELKFKLFIEQPATSFGMRMYADEFSKSETRFVPLVAV